MARGNKPAPETTTEDISFAELLETKADDHKRRPALPAGFYMFEVTQQRFGKSARKQTPFCEYDCKVLSACEDVPADTDLHNRSFRKTHYLTGPAAWRLTDFLRKCQVDVQGRTFNETIPEAIGCTIKGYLNQRPSNEPGSEDVFNELTSVVEA